jgi:hypothetical protein
MPRAWCFAAPKNIFLAASRWAGRGWGERWEK